MSLLILSSTDHSIFGCKYKGIRYRFLDKTFSQVININTALIEYVTKKLANK